MAVRRLFVVTLLCVSASGCFAGGPLGDALPDAGGDDADVSTRSDASVASNADASDAWVEAEAGPDPCADAARGDGSRFTDLYRDFFGPTGLADCSASSMCHVSGGKGALNSGYICSPDQVACWTTMTRSIVPEGGSRTPEMTTLYLALRKAPPLVGGPMPKSSSFAFCPHDMQRIADWIAAGAPND